MAFDTIRGTAKQKTGIGFYPCNYDNESVWGALDFDAHNPDERIGRAYVFAGKAFDLLCREAPNLWLIAGTSGESGGWHIFIFSPHFHPTGDWARFLREVVDRIGAPLQKGIAEIFPGDNRGLKYGIRAPGSYNPKDNSFDLIAFDGVTRNLSALPKEKSLPLYARSNAYDEKTVLPSRSIELPEITDWLKEYAITAVRTRHDKLIGLIGATYYQIGRGVAKRIAELQFAKANPTPVTSLTDHLSDFDEAWEGMQRLWRTKLSPVEREAFDSLTSAIHRDAYKILQSWAKTDSPDFRIHSRTFANRLGVTLQTACNIRRHFCSLGILRPTSPYVPHKLCARFLWIAGTEPEREQAARLSLHGRTS